MSGVGQASACGGLQPDLPRTRNPPHQHRDSRNADTDLRDSIDVGWANGSHGNGRGQCPWVERGQLHSYCNSGKSRKRALVDEPVPPAEGNQDMKFSNDLSRRLVPALALALCMVVSLLLAQAPAQTPPSNPAIPDWAYPGSASHRQVAPPADFRRPSKTTNTPNRHFRRPD